MSYLLTLASRLKAPPKAPATQTVEVPKAPVVAPPATQTVETPSVAAFLLPSESVEVAPSSTSSDEAPAELAVQEVVVPVEEATPASSEA